MEYYKIVLNNKWFGTYSVIYTEILNSSSKRPPQNIAKFNPRKRNKIFFWKERKGEKVEEIFLFKRRKGQT